MQTCCIAATKGQRRLCTELAPSRQLTWGEGVTPMRAMRASTCSTICVFSARVAASIRSDMTCSAGMQQKCVQRGCLPAPTRTPAAWLHVCAGA